MKKTGPILVLLLAAFGLSSAASALSAQAILEKADKAVNPYKDRRFTVEMNIHDGKGSVKRTELRIAERKYGKQRILIYRAPADVKGMGILVQDSSSMYIYLPSYNRVRRVAMHAKKQTFMDSDFAFEDMGAARLANEYEAKILSEKKKYLWLELTPKKGKEPAYSKIEIKVDRKRWLIWKLKYFDSDGKHLKTEIRSEYVKIDGVRIHRRLRMRDERRKHWTDIIVKTLEVNVGLSSRLFSRRGLIRGKI